MIEEIKKLIQNGLGIKNPHIDSNTPLGETGVGLDSQEIIDFTCMLDKQFQIKLPACSFSKKHSIGDVIKTIRSAQESSQSLGKFEGKIETSIGMRCSPQMAYQAIYEMDKWPEKLPHVKRIETLYNDGIYQEFLMDVLSDSGMIQVRSIRRCIPDEGITFFQPKPPKFLKHHCGGWTFKNQATGCIVTTWHQWNLEPKIAHDLFPAKDNATTEERITNVLLAHAELALKTWKALLETA